MHKKFFLGILGLVVVSLGSSWYIAQAAQPGGKKPLALYDGNSAFLGEILNVEMNGAGYMIYEPSLDGILGYTMCGNDPCYSIQVSEINYTQADCQGTKYSIASPGAQAGPYQPQFIINYTDSNQFYKQNSLAAQRAILSTETVGAGCINQSPNLMDTRELTLVTIPAYLINPTLPLTVK